MANTLMARARQGFADGEIDWSGDDIKVVLVDSGYTFSAAHEDLADVAGAARVDTSANLSGKTSTGGVLDADDVTFPSVTAGDTVTGLFVFQDTGVEATSLLIAWFDTDGASMPISRWHCASSWSKPMVAWLSTPTAAPTSHSTG